MEAETDRQRWDRKYAAGEGPAHFEPKPFLSAHRHLLTGGRALDIACGLGGNALYLAGLGYQIDALDISGVALEKAQSEARRRGVQISFVQVDLDRWWVPGRCYDLILVFYYLNLDLTTSLAQALRPGGLLFQANRNTRFLQIRPSFPQDYLLEPGELGRHVTRVGLRILQYTDGTGDEPHNTELIARRPS